ncbi:MAG: hypothetical protein AVDCRST_MAG76-2509, partial [uncultured Acidimicrobiales bacterium]
APPGPGGGGGALGGCPGSGSLPPCSGGGGGGHVLTGPGCHVETTCLRSERRGPDVERRAGSPSPAPLAAAASVAAFRADAGPGGRSPGRRHRRAAAHRDPV